MMYTSTACTRKWTYLKPPSKPGAEPIDARWIDIDQGNSNTPSYRSRLVAKEFKDKYMEGLFAGTPPLEALRFLVSDVATSDGDEEKVLMINDVSRAFFEAPIGRDVCVELPEECLSQSDRDNDVVGKFGEGGLEFYVRWVALGGGPPAAMEGSRALDPAGLKQGGRLDGECGHARRKLQRSFVPKIKWYQ